MMGAGRLRGDPRSPLAGLRARRPLHDFADPELSKIEFPAFPSKPATSDVLVGRKAEIFIIRQHSSNPRPVAEIFPGRPISDGSPLVDPAKISSLALLPFEETGRPRAFEGPAPSHRPHVAGSRARSAVPAVWPGASPDSLGSRMR